MPSPSVALLRTQSDDRLVTLAAAGHERAFEAIVERYRRSLLRRARRHLPDARAEDAVQQALVSAWTALRRGDEVHDLRAWLHRIVHNTSLNALRVAGYDYEELRESLEGSGGTAEAAERRAVVRGTLAGLAALPERQREALLRIAVEGRSQDEVAEQLGLSQGAVRQLVHRARTTLRAAATAMFPLPWATWLAGGGSGGRADLALRVGELVGGAGAGAGATLAKAGTVVVLAGGAVAGPAVVRQPEERMPKSAAVVAAAPKVERAAAPRDVAPEPAVPAGTGSEASEKPSGNELRSDGRDGGKGEHAEARAGGRGGRGDDRRGRDNGDKVRGGVPGAGGHGDAWRDEGDDARVEWRGDRERDGGDRDGSGYRDGSIDDGGGDAGGFDRYGDGGSFDRSGEGDDGGGEFGADDGRSGYGGDPILGAAPNGGIEGDERSGDDDGPELADGGASGPGDED